MAARLEGLTILVTRPAAQADHLCELLGQAGARSVALPVLEITAIEDTESRLRLRHASAWDMVIFVSRNAVVYALPFIRRATMPTVVAIGRKTADALRRQDIHVDIEPREYNSEALLAMPGMQRVQGRRILIVRGRGGREKLAQALQEHGATVEYAEVYRRSRPDQNAARLQSMLAHQEIDVLTVASGEALHNLVSLAGDEREELFTLPLFVLSDRLARLAQQAGFADTGKIHVAPQASDEGMLGALQQWRQQEDADE